MEAAVEHDDLGRGDAADVGVLARELDRAFVRLGAGVGEEDLAADTCLRQGLAKPQRRPGVVEVRGASEARRLLGDRRDDPRVAMPGVVHREAGEEVEVLLALVVPQA